MQGEGSEDYKEVLNAMKVEEHLEKREEQLARKAFVAIKVGSKGSEYCRHYEMSLFCKVMKGFMMEQMRVSMFRERLENVYVGMLTRNHFLAFKKFRDVVRK